MCRKKYVVVIGLIVGVLMMCFGCGSKNNTGNSSNTVNDSGLTSEEPDEELEIPEENAVTPPDAESYYEKNSDVVSVIEADDSKEVLTEEETADTLTARGFTQFEISSSYSMDGEYYDAADIESTGSEKHPMYETYHVTTNGDIWTIFMINGVVMANPVSYNLQSDLGVQVIVSETETIMSYDSTTNSFFETVPDESALVVVQVDKINAETLETLTLEKIDEYTN